MGRLAERIDRASLRERLLIFAGLAVLVLAIGDALLVQPEIARNKRLARELAQRQGDAAQLRQQIAQLAASQVHRPDVAMRERLLGVRREIEQVEQLIVEEQRRLARPEQMRALLQELLGRTRRVSLVEMRTVETTAAALPGTNAKPAPAKPLPSKTPIERVVYRHGMEIVVSGQYLDLLQYVTELERLPTRLYWGGAELDASGYPVVRLKVNVYTLSLDKAWMNV